jgi:hypothetical protein
MEYKEALKKERAALGPELPIRAFIEEHYKIITQSDHANKVFSDQIAEPLSRMAFAEVFNICISGGYLSFDEALNFSFLLYNLAEVFDTTFDIDLAFKIIQGFFNNATEEFITAQYETDDDPDDSDDESEDG